MPLPNPATLDFAYMGTGIFGNTDSNDQVLSYSLDKAYIGTGIFSSYSPALVGGEKSYGFIIG